MTLIYRINSLQNTFIIKQINFCDVMFSFLRGNASRVLLTMWRRTPGLRSASSVLRLRRTCWCLLLECNPYRYTCHCLHCSLLTKISLPLLSFSLYLCILTNLFSWLNLNSHMLSMLLFFIILNNYLWGQPVSLYTFFLMIYNADFYWLFPLISYVIFTIQNVTYNRKLEFLYLKEENLIF